MTVLLIGVFILAIATVVVLLVARRRRLRRRVQASRPPEAEIQRIASQPCAAAGATWLVNHDPQLAIEAEAQEPQGARVAVETQQREITEKQTMAGETETHRQADEGAPLATEARIPQAEDGQTTPEEAAHHVGEEARVVTGKEPQPQLDEEGRRRARVDEQEVDESPVVAEAVQSEVAEEERIAREIETKRQVDGRERFAETPVPSTAGEKVLPRGEAEREAEQKPSLAVLPELPTIEPRPDRAVTTPVPPAPAQPRRRAPRYRPPVRGTPPPPSLSSVPVGAAPESKPQSATTRSQSARVELRILFERGGHCRVSLLPRRPQGSPEECTLSTGNSSIDFVALEEEWYQYVPVTPEDLGVLLRTGFVWTDKATGQEWLLAGRDVFVLATGTTHRGFVSCPRLVLGREHVILCAVPRLQEVEGVLRNAGCHGWRQWGEDDGAPQGWVVLSASGDAGRVRGLVPRVALSPEGSADILDVLRPLPEIEIALEGGVPLGYSSWLAGQPPAIKVYGDPEHTQTLLIDRQDATRSEQGAYTAPGWDKPGTHEIWCSGTTGSYSLVAIEPGWSPWAAYSFRSSSGSAGRVAICGPLVRPFTNGEPFSETSRRELIKVIPSNPVFLGALPGEVSIAMPRDDIRGAQCIASPPFEPIWALPAQPLRCNKTQSHVLLIGRTVEPKGIAASSPHPRGNAKAVGRWRQFILDASRKGLSVEPPTQEAAELWDRYKRCARELRRMSR